MLLLASIANVVAEFKLMNRASLEFTRIGPPHRRASGVVALSFRPSIKTSLVGGTLHVSQQPKRIPRNPSTRPYKSLADGHRRGFVAHIIGPHVSEARVPDQALFWAWHSLQLHLTASRSLQPRILRARQSNHNKDEITVEGFHKTRTDPKSTSGHFQL